MSIASRNRLRALVIASVSAAAIALVMATAAAGTRAAHRNPVQAMFTFQAVQPSHYSHLHLTITKYDEVLFDAPVRSRYCLLPWCGPAEIGSGASSVHVRDLGPGEHQDVVLGLFTQGAHCCFVDQVYRWNGRHYVRSEHDFRDFPAMVEDVGRTGARVFVSADAAFAYTSFSVFATAGEPIQIWKFAKGRFSDVTRRYPSQVAGDAAAWWNTFQRHLHDGEGVIAAWAADEDLLGHSGLVARTLAVQARLGHLRSLIPGAPTGKAFISTLQRFLRTHGYAP